MAHPVVVSHSIYTSSGNETEVWIPRPSGAGNGDLIVFFLGHSTNNANYASRPTAYGVSQLYQGSPNGNVTYAVFISVRTTFDPIEYIFDCNNGRTAAIALRIEGHYLEDRPDTEWHFPENAVDIFGSISSNTGNTWNIQGVTPAENETLALSAVVSSGNADPITSTSTFSDIDSRRSGSAVTTACFEKNALNPPSATGNNFGTKTNTSRWYGNIFTIRPLAATGPVPTDLDIGHLDARPTLQDVGLVGGADMGITHIDAEPTMHLLSLESSALLNLAHRDARPQLYPITVPVGTDFDFQPLDARPQLRPLGLVGSAEMGTEHLDARPTIQLLTLDGPGQFALDHLDARPQLYPITIPTVTDLDIGHLDARPTLRDFGLEGAAKFDLDHLLALPTLWDIALVVPGQPTILDFIPLDARPTLHSLGLQGDIQLNLIPLDARPALRDMAIATVSNVNISHLEAFASLHNLGLLGSADLNMDHLDAIPTVRPMTIEGVIEQRGESPIMKILAPRAIIKMLAQKNILKILK